eukprot:SAG25_NODE_21_length_22373_cov_13.904373_9_plen_32_part_00
MADSVCTTTLIGGAFLMLYQVYLTIDPAELD